MIVVHYRSTSLDKKKLFMKTMAVMAEIPCSCSLRNRLILISADGQKNQPHPRRATSVHSAESALPNYHTWLEIGYSPSMIKATSCSQPMDPKSGDVLCSL